MKEREVIVIKLGSAIVTNTKGNINQSILKNLAIEINSLSKRFNIIIVSSGAVASGKKFIKNYKGTILERKAAAAIGNPILIKLYSKHFLKHHIQVAQALCERHHFSNRTQLIQLKDTFKTFWQNNILPIVNENDLVNNTEIKFSDNDELATLLAISFEAKQLIICTSAGGFWNKDKQIIPLVEKIDHLVLNQIDNSISSVGIGGMLSKLTFTKLATSMGIEVLMCGLNSINPIESALNYKNGTVFLAQKSTLKAKQKWLASGSLTFGKIYIDVGALKALKQRKSLLTVGIKAIDGIFNIGEVVQIIDTNQETIGVAKVKLASKEMSLQFTSKNIIAAHADDIVIF